MGKGLHWAIFVILGIIVSVASYYINSKRGGFILFIYLGIVLFVYGLAKVVISHVNTKTRIEVKHADKRDITQQELLRRQHAQRQQEAQDAQPRASTRCQNCGLTIYRYDNFCSRCGLRQR